MIWFGFMLLIVSIMDRKITKYNPDANRVLNHVTVGYIICVLLGIVIPFLT